MSTYSSPKDQRGAAESSATRGVAGLGTAAPGSGAARLDEARRDLLARAAQLGRDRAGDETPGADLIDRFFRFVAPEDFLGREPVDVLGAVTSIYRLASQRAVGTALVRVLTPSVDEHGWDSAHTVVQVVTDDMPFLVNSITAELNRLGHEVQLVVHPQIVVRRGSDGHLIECLDLDVRDVLDPSNVAIDPPVDSMVESWTHVEIQRVGNQSSTREIVDRLHIVLDDVRAAVVDWQPMRLRALALADQLQSTPPPTLGTGDADESAALLRWLAEDNFTFLGYREYELVGSEGDEALVPVAGSGLGLLRGEESASRSFAKLPAAVRASAREVTPLILTKANSRSTVHRSVYFDYIGVKSFNEAGEVVGERRFLGLFASSAYTDSVTRIPVLRRKSERLLEDLAVLPESHLGKDVLTFLEMYPRDELFQVTGAQLVDIATGVMHVQDRRATKLFLRPDRYGRFVSALVYLPRDRYTTKVRQRVEQILTDAVGGTSVDYTTLVSESLLARLHYVIRIPTGASLPTLDAEALEARLANVTRSWDDDFRDALVHEVGEAAAAPILRSWNGVFPEAYKEDFAPRSAVSDVRHVESLGPNGLAVAMYESVADDGADRRLKVFRAETPMLLSEMLPVLQSLGVVVVDERPYEIVRAGQSRAWIYDFGLRFEQLPNDPDTLKERFEETFLQSWTGVVEVDRLNALVVAAGMTSREIAIIRAYVLYLRQAGTAFSQRYIEACVLANVPLARLMIRLFETRFEPDLEVDREASGNAIAGEFFHGLDAVASLDHDRILRSLWALIQATLRTNAYQLAPNGERKPAIAFKFDPRAVPDLPKPLPRFEIWVYSPAVEGVHLRFGKVARGGLRWSDRPEDFRTEILGLVKAQMVKNAVIVPVGAKGGFVMKQGPAPSDRDAWLAAGIAAYTTFVSSLLDITDNLVAGQVVPPERVVRHDGDDTYLVVAADKGTATFSDIANGVSQQYGFWLGDAFASGGSVGYDHKAMGITARGAWESVKRHFRELGVNTQADPFTVVGVGDMSGDVFGNGMLLSEHIRLVAAFDHRHIFLDPNPDAATSFVERRRLFDLPRSSWDDYDRSLISPGGAVFPRSAKSIALTPEVKRALGLEAHIETLTPAELLRAILCAPVDLLWNGGIGTYVKATRESHSEVGDKANDSIRINGLDLRCKVVGEGGNLGCTQLGRIEASRAGVHINTDAIDNSAGVDTSDHEVNIKILLDAVVREGDLTLKQRNVLLASMTDEVGRQVLLDNYEQNVLLGNARAQAFSMLTVHERLIQSLEAKGLLDRAIEFIPTDAELKALEVAGEGLSSPEFAVLVAYSKIGLTEDLLNSTLADEPWFGGVLTSYFPESLTSRSDFAPFLAAHPLRREIIVTMVANEMVNRGGITFIHRACEETGASAPEVARAFMFCREVFDLPALWRRIALLDNEIPTAAQCALYLESRRLLDRAVRWVLQSRGGRVDIAEELKRFGGVATTLTAQIPSLLVGVEQDRLQRRAAEYGALGAPRDLALEVASLLDAYSALDIAAISRRSGIPILEVAELYFALSERFEVDRYLVRITELPRGDRWSALARSSLRSDLYGALAGLTSRVIDETPLHSVPLQRIEAWESANEEGLARARATLADIGSQDEFNLATLSVALRTIRTLVGQGPSE